MSRDWLDALRAKLGEPGSATSAPVPPPGDLTADLAPPADPVGCTSHRHTGPFQRLGYLTRCGGCGQAVR
jgi:hypothetical protein